MKLTNFEMFSMIETLNSHLDKKDLVGYAAARNTRILNTECAEFIKRRDELIGEYGEPYVDENGRETGQTFISPQSQNFDEFAKELEKYGFIEHDVELYQIPETDVIGVLSGNEILSLDWMLKSTEGEE